MDATNLPSIRLLADYIWTKGVGIAFVAVTVTLLFVYFTKLIFKKESNEERLEEILRLSIEIKLKIEELLGRK